MVESGRWRDQMAYHWVFADLEPFEFDTFPYEIHTIEKVGVLSRERREKAIRAAGYNTFLLRSADVTIDLLTDSGTTAMSTDQWAAYEGVRASATTSDEYHDLVETLQEITGYEHIIPTHQGRAAEHILSEIMIKPGQIVPGNMYFTTTKLHQELAGGVFVDVIVDEAHDPQSDFPWKGNIDLAKLDAPRRRARRREDRLRLLRALREHGRRPAREHGQHEGGLRVLRAARDPGVLRRDALRRERLHDPGARSALPRRRDPRHPARDDALRRRLHGQRQEGLPDQHRRRACVPRQRRVGASRPRSCCASTRATSPTAAWPPRTWRRSPAASRRCSTTATSARGSSRPSSWASCCSTPACRSSRRPAATRSSSTPSASCRTSTRTSSRPSAWRPRSTSRPACGRWSAATSRRAATRRPARTTGRRSSWCA